MLTDLLKRVCNSLDEYKIPYMISGSIAMNMYAIPRMTRDIDIVIELTLNRMDEFIALFPDSYYEREVIRNEIIRKGLFNIIDHSTGFKLDFIIRKDTDYFRMAFERRQRISELDIEFWVISLEDLIIAKIIWIQQLQSERQLRDIENLLLVPGKDMDYILHWCKKLELNTFDLVKI